MLRNAILIKYKVQDVFYIGDKIYLCRFNIYTIIYMIYNYYCYSFKIRNFQLT